MADQTSIQAAIARGYAIAASKLGAPVQQIRPTGPLLPLQQPVLNTLPAFFDQDPSFGMKKAWSRRSAGGAEGYASIDTTNVLPGDILVGADTYFVTRFEPIRPLQVALTNTVFDILTDAPEVDPGPRGRNGRVLNGPSANTPAIATRWPAWKGVGGRAEIDPTRLPSDAKAPSWSVLLPIIPGITIVRQNILREASGLTMTISAAIETQYGWQLIANEDDV